ncbi:MAG: hypothetical protein J1D87_02595, partial [Lachnospiraceae bacterium]|nr:hypothetical protein [Lachnospiraceae bacterium]
MKNKLTQNWGLKLGSFLFAAIIWLVVTNINDPIRTYTELNVKVNIQNADLITNSGQVYEVLDDSDIIGVVTISAKRSIIESFNNSNVVAVADMNELTSLNTIPIHLSTNKYNDKLESIRGSIDSVRLNIEDRTSKTLQIRTDTTGTVREGYILGESTLDQNLIEISGPESIISKVKRAAVTVNVSGFTNSIGTDSEIRLYDEDDNIISSNSISKSISKVRVTIEILETKTVPINWNVGGTPARGYQATGEITATRNNILIAGRSKSISNISSIDVPETDLDITGATENVEKLIDIKNYLPDGIILAEENFQGMIQVDIAVEQNSERIVTMYMNRIQILNMPEGLEGKIEADENTYQITLVGLAAVLEELNANSIQASVDVAEYMEDNDIEDLRPGRHTIELKYNLDDNIEVKENIKVRLNVME